MKTKHHPARIQLSLSWFRAGYMLDVSRHIHQEFCMCWCKCGGHGYDNLPMRGCNRAVTRESRHLQMLLVKKKFWF